MATDSGQYQRKAQLGGSCEYVYFVWKVVALFLSCLYWYSCWLLLLWLLFCLSLDTFRRLHFNTHFFHAFVSELGGLIMRYPRYTESTAPMYGPLMKREIRLPASGNAVSLLFFSILWIALFFSLSFSFSLTHLYLNGILLFSWQTNTTNETFAFEHVREQLKDNIATAGTALFCELKLNLIDELNSITAQCMHALTYVFLHAFLVASNWLIEFQCAMAVLCRWMVSVFCMQSVWNEIWINSCATFLFSLSLLGCLNKIQQPG